jgi:hypothetical protein
MAILVASVLATFLIISSPTRLTLITIYLSFSLSIVPLLIMCARVKGVVLVPPRLLLAVTITHVRVDGGDMERMLSYTLSDPTILCSLVF